MSDTEKVSFNLSVVDLGKVDLLVEQGFYSSRTDFMVTAARNLLATHAVSISEAVAKNSMVVGVHAVGRKTLEGLQAKHKQLDVNVVGVLVLSQDVGPQLARATIRSVKIRGALRASPEVKEALKDRMQ
jgi:Arc/MetJ-type ribon-helix-helix transcriptional regulator